MYFRGAASSGGRNFRPFVKKGIRRFPLRERTIHICTTEEFIMEKTKKRLKIACYGILVYVVICAVDLVVSIVAPPDLHQLYPELEKSMVSYAWIISLVSVILSMGLHLLLALWSLRRIESQSIGIGPAILEFLLSILAFFNLYESIELLVEGGVQFMSLWNIIFAVIWIVVLAVYDWFAIQFNHRHQKEKK